MGESLRMVRGYTGDNDSLSQANGRRNGENPGDGRLGRAWIGEVVVAHVQGVPSSFNQSLVGGALPWDGSTGVGWAL